MHAGIDLLAEDLLGALDGQRGDLLAQRLARLDHLLLGLGLRGGDDLGGFLAGACLRLLDHLLAEPLAHLGPDQAREDVGRVAGRVGNDDADLPVRIVLRVGAQAESEQQEQLFHVISPELWAAEVVFDLREEYTQLKLGILLPFLNQEESWNEMNREYYQSILAQADFVDAIFKKPYEGPQQLRIKNQYMVQKSDAMLILYDSEKEGSPKYPYLEAQKRQDQSTYPIWQINFDDLQQVVQEDQWETDS